MAARDPPPADYCYECRALVRYKIIHVHRRRALDDCPEECTLAVCSTCGCNDPLISCSGVILNGDTHEPVDGRRNQTLDGPP
jgi:hypothetical protein